ncbi:MAG: nucleotidyltransferase family protein [Pseudomonadota bacterium]
MIQLDSQRIAAFCRQWRVAELALFGSALRPDFGPHSDVDVLVSFEPQARVSLFDLMEMQAELEEIFGRPVDLATRRGIQSSRNRLRREAILSTARVVYAA